MRKFNKKGSAMIEFILVLTIYIFLLGFMITGFQIMHNKMVYSMAAYEGVRTAIAYNPVINGYDINKAKQNASKANDLLIGTTIGGSKVDIVSEGDYYNCTVSGKIKFLFPIINPNGVGIQDNINISSSFVMRKERGNGIN